MTTEAETGVMWPHAKERATEAGRSKEQLVLGKLLVQPCQHSFQTSGPGIVREPVSVVLSHPVCGTLLQ